MKRRGQSTSRRPQLAASLIAVPAPKPFLPRPGRWNPRLRAVVAAGGAALLLAVAFAPDAAAQAQSQPSEFRHLQGDPRVPLQSLHPIVEQVLPAVVNVSVAIKDAEESELAAPDENDKALPTSPFEEFLRRYFGGQSPQAPSHRAEPRGLEQVALGSGFIIDPMGYVVTNNHLVEEAETITVVLQDNSRHPARLVGRDALTDVALLKIDSDGKLPYVRWGDSDAAQVSATGSWRSEILSASAGPSRLELFLRAGATSTPAPTTTICRSTRR